MRPAINASTLPRPSRAHVGCCCLNLSRSTSVSRPVCHVSVTLWYGPVAGRVLACRTGPLPLAAAPPLPPRLAVLLALRSLLMIVSKL